MKYLPKRINSIEIIKDIRQTGTILAIELKSDSSGYASSVRQKLYQDFLDQGVLLRPLGNVIYILPPYCIKEKELEKVYNGHRESAKKDKVTIALSEWPQLDLNEKLIMQEAFQKPLQLIQKQPNHKEYYKKRECNIKIYEISNPYRTKINQ